MNRRGIIVKQALFIYFQRLHSDFKTKVKNSCEKYQMDFTKLYLMAKIFIPLAFDWLYKRF